MVSVGGAAYSHFSFQLQTPDLLGFVLDHAPVEVVTIELDDMDEQTFLDQINIMRSYINSHQ
jgi:hypothetical protein